jgi:hypothetical protein
MFHNKKVGPEKQQMTGEKKQAASLDFHLCQNSSDGWVRAHCFSASAQALHQSYYLANIEVDDLVYLYYIHFCMLQVQLSGLAATSLHYEYCWLVGADVMKWNLIRQDLISLDSILDQIMGFP